MYHAIVHLKDKITCVADYLHMCHKDLQTHAAISRQCKPLRPATCWASHLESTQQLIIRMFSHLKITNILDVRYVFWSIYHTSGTYFILKVHIMRHYTTEASHEYQCVANSPVQNCCDGPITKTASKLIIIETMTLQGSTTHWSVMRNASPRASYQIRKIAGNVRNVFPVNDFKGNR